MVVMLVLFVFSCVAYVPEPENITLLKTALSLYRKFEQYADAVLIAMQLCDMDIVQEIFTTCPDPVSYTHLTLPTIYSV